MANCVCWSESAKMKYRVSKRPSAFLVERLLKKRMIKVCPQSGETSYSHEFHVEKTFYVKLPDFRCDPQICAQSYYMGTCEHETLIGELYRAWQHYREGYLREVLRKIAFLVARLRDLKEHLEECAKMLKEVQYSRLVGGRYILFYPDFLAKFSVTQLLIILRSIRFPVAQYSYLDMQEIIQRACKFNHQQFQLEETG
jgi:hypothetical protein